MPLLPLRLPNAAPSRIDVWRVEFDFDAPPPGCDALSEDERERAASFRRDEDRTRFTATRGALRRLLAERLDEAPLALRFGRGAHGKPFLDHPAAIEFNVSHSGGFALIALSAAGAVGVDIERIDEAVDARRLSEVISSPTELAAGEAGVEAFFERWAAKEAVAKALGFGVGERLRSFSVLPGEGGAYALAHDAEDWSGVGAARLEAPGGYVAALAWASRVDGR